MYLPLTFKYHDLTIQNISTIDLILQKYHASETFYQAIQYENGNYVMRYPIGLSIFYLPFYFLADIITPFTSYPADGFSKPYQICILIGCLIYSLIGLFTLRKVLLFFVDDKYVAITMVIIALGTNYLFHAGIHGQGAMSHNFLFTLYALIFYYTIVWHKHNKLKDVIFLALFIGLAMISRASEVVALLIPISFNIFNKSSFFEKIKLLKQFKNQIILFAIILIAVNSIQLLYWKYSSGSFFINPYGASNPGEGLELLHPHFSEILFSFRKGLFIYTPILIFAFMGFHFLWKVKKEIFLSILIYCFLSFYIVASWSCWWFGSCFGNRALIPTYVALSIPLALSVQYFITSKMKLIFLILVGLFTTLNCFQSWQIYQGILHESNMSRAYYFSTFLQISPPNEEQNKLLLRGKINSYEEIFTKNDSLIHSLANFRIQNFETSRDQISLKDLSTDIKHSGKSSLILKSGSLQKFSLQESLENLTQKKYTWIKASLWVFLQEIPMENDISIALHMSHNKYIFKLTRPKFNFTTLKINCWNRIEFTYLTPEDLRSTRDRFYFTIENKGKSPINIDDVLIESYEPIIDQSVF
ncbi:MAG: hypothetical protein IPM51_05985 [Sphingobacteriaceae bacterium]|nr:hypothetical protein [Sphingobacteriaceae bacterium]